jgi:hypothetical protein
VTVTAAAATLSPGGGVTVAGVVQDATAVVASGTAEATSITSMRTDSRAGAFDPYIAHFDDDGHLAWARRQGGPAQEDCVDIAATGDGGVVLTGSFGVLASPGRGISPPRTAIFGPGEPNQIALIGSGYNDAYVARFDGGGHLVWARPQGQANAQPSSESGFLAPAAVATYRDGSSITVGRAAGAIVFGKGEPTAQMFDLGTEAMFAARLAP